ncbi:nucleoside 2-deoxyribosyltransferase [Mycolicibacterium senegalense]|uniref:nucleoside 2-deoxyribosyltransferase n=1 Tax=Mycolicibacterium senegalense TaxID=1796 RepID=UPI00362BBD13
MTMAPTADRNYEMRAYISGPLQGSPDLVEARALYEDVASAVAQAGAEPYVPHLHTDPEHDNGLSAVDVFRKDVAALNQANLIIAHVGIPSTGVGAELALAAVSGIAIVGIARWTESVSRFAAGLITESGGHLVHFRDSADLHVQLNQQIAEAAQHLRDRAAS